MKFWKNVAFLACMGVASLACASAATTSATPATIQPSTKAASYAGTSSLPCGDLDVRIETFCELDDAGKNGCFLQKLNIRHKPSGKEKNKLYLYENYQQDRSLIMSMVCVKARGKDRLVLEASNLGSCKVCEWEDYFSAEGAFLGSSRAIHGATNFKPRALPGNFYEKNGLLLDKQDHFTETGRVNVSYVPGK